MEKDKIENSDNSSDEEKIIPDCCLICKKNPIEYICMPCRCPSFCSTCAKKVATGGKCKTCKQMYPGLKRI